MPKFSPEKIIGIGVIVTVLATFILSMFMLSLQPRMSGYLTETTEKSNGFILEKIGSYTTDSAEISTFEVNFIGESGYIAVLSKDTVLQINIMDGIFVGDVILVDRYGVESPIMQLGGGEKGAPPSTNSININVPADTKKVRFSTEVSVQDAKMEIFDTLSNVQQTYSVGFSTAGTLGGGEKGSPPAETLGGGEKG